VRRLGVHWPRMCQIDVGQGCARGLKLSIKRVEAMGVRIKRAEGSVYSIDPCGMCVVGVMNNTVECAACGVWVRRECSEVRGALTEVGDCKCRRCRGFHGSEEEVKCVKLENGVIKVDGFRNFVV